MDTDDSRVHFTSTEKGEVAGGDTSHIGGENEGCMRGQLHPPREGDKKIKRTNNPGNMLFSPSVTFPTYLFCLEKRHRLLSFRNNNIAASSSFPSKRGSKWESHLWSPPPHVFGKLLVRVPTHLQSARCGHHWKPSCLLTKVWAGVRVTVSGMGRHLLIKHGQALIRGSVWAAQTKQVNHQKPNKQSHETEAENY